MRVWWMAAVVLLTAAIWLCGGTIAGVLALAIAAAVCWPALRAPRAAPTGDRENSALSRILCGDAVDTPEAIQPDVTCAQALQHMIGSGIPAIPIAVGRRFLGILELNDFAKLQDRELRFVYTGAIMTPADELPSVPATASASEAVKRMRNTGRAHIPVLKDTVLSGLVSRDSLRRAINESPASSTPQSPEHAVPR